LGIHVSKKIITIQAVINKRGFFDKRQVPKSHLRL